jgi:hypothetical protein
MTIAGTTLLRRVRIELQDDEPTAFRWSDEELLTYANDAVRDYSRTWRVSKRATLLATLGAEGNTVFPLPDGSVGVLRIGYVTGTSMMYLSENPYRQGEVLQAPGVGNGSAASGQNGRPAWVWGTGNRERIYLGHYELTADPDDVDTAAGFRLDFQPDQNSSFVVDYVTQHELFDPLDPTVATSIPDEDEEMLCFYVEGKAWMRVFGQDAALSRWDTDGSRDDSPILPLNTRFLQLYEKKKADKMARPRGLRLRRR